VLFHFLITMAIFIPSKTEKQISTAVDCLRVMAWQHYKATNKDLKVDGKPVKGLELYAMFKTEWLEHEIHQMDLTQLGNFIKSLGYTGEELLQIRSDYYEQKSNYQNYQNQSSESTESTESTITKLKESQSPKSPKPQKQEIESDYDPVPF